MRGGAEYVICSPLFLGSRDLQRLFIDGEHLLLTPRYTSRSTGEIHSCSACPIFLNIFLMHSLPSSLR